MKKMIKTFSLVLSLLLPAQTNLFAQNDNDNDNHNDNKKKYEFVKSKSVNKSYNVSASDILNIQNSFGSVKVTTWDRNEIKVDVEIEVSANTDAFAQKTLDRILITDEKSGTGISFKTFLKNINRSVGDKNINSMNLNDINNSNGDKSNMSINYSIIMPATNPLQIKNEFGSTILPDYRGPVELISKFGKLTTGNLPNVKSIQVEFGNAKFQNLTDGSVIVKYSGAEFGKLSGKIKLNLEFCSSIVMNLDNSLTGLDIKASYSNVNLKPLTDLSASYNISTSFGTLKNRTAIKFDRDAENKDDQGPQFDHQYNGRSGNGNIQIKIASTFGNVILGEPGPDDMKDKNKQKSKSRTS
jgi:hypothetical protein